MRKKSARSFVSLRSSQIPAEARVPVPAVLDARDVVRVEAGEREERRVRAELAVASELAGRGRRDRLRVEAAVGRAGPAVDAGALRAEDPPGGLALRVHRSARRERARVPGEHDEPGASRPGPLGLLRGVLRGGAGRQQAERGGRDERRERGGPSGERGVRSHGVTPPSALYDRSPSRSPSSALPDGFTLTRGRRAGVPAGARYGSRPMTTLATAARRRGAARRPPPAARRAARARRRPRPLRRLGHRRPGSRSTRTRRRRSSSSSTGSTSCSRRRPARASRSSRPSCTSRRWPRGSAASTPARSRRSSTRSSSTCAALFGPENVGMMTGDAAVNRDAPIICCTAEILMNLAVREADAARRRRRDGRVPLLRRPRARRGLAGAAARARADTLPAHVGDARATPAPSRRRSRQVTGRKVAAVRDAARPVPLEFEYLETPLHETHRGARLRRTAPIYLVNFTQRAAAEQAQNLMSRELLLEGGEGADRRGARRLPLRLALRQGLPALPPPRRRAPPRGPAAPLPAASSRSSRRAGSSRWSPAPTRSAWA